MPFPRIQFQDQSISLLQDNVGNEFGRFSAMPFIGGVLIQNTAILSGSNEIIHGLGRTPQLWVIADLNANITLYRTAWTKNTISLTASGPATISLWVW